MKLRLLLFIPIVLSFLVITGIILLSIYYRPVSDDLIFVYKERLMNGFEFVHFSLTATGRISSILLYIIGFSVPGFLSFSPAMGVLVLLFGALLLVRATTLSLFKRHDAIATLAISSSIIASALLLTPGLYASLFWFTSATVHVWGYGLLMVYIAALMRLRPLSSPRSFRFIASYIVLPLFISLLSESLAVTILTMNAGLLLVTHLRKLHIPLPVTVSGISASLISLVILYFSPGSIQRREALEQMNSSAPLLANLSETPARIANDIFNVIPMVLPNQLVLTVLVALGFIITLFVMKKATSARKLLLFLIVTSAVLVLIYLINVFILFAMTPQPVVPYRMYFLPALLLSIFCLLLGATIGHLAQPGLDKHRWLNILVALCATVVAFTALLSQSIPSYLLSLKDQFSAHASRYDERDAYVKKMSQDGECVITLDPLPILPGVDDITSSMDSGLNRNVFYYYNPPRANATKGLNFFDRYPDETCGVQLKNQ